MKRVASPLIILFAQVAFGQSLPILDPAPPSPAFSRNGIKVWISSESDYSSVLQAKLGKELVAELGPLDPFSAVVQNNGRAGIRSILLRITMTDATGKQSWGTSRLDFGRRPLGVGGMAVITPDGGITQALYSLAGGRSAPSKPLPSLVADFVSRRLTSRAIRSMKPELDSVVLDTGGVIGPDVFDVVGEAQARSAAVASVIAKFSDSSLTDTSLLEWLDNQITEVEKEPAYLGGGMFNHVVMQTEYVLHTARFLLTSRDRDRAAAALSQFSTSLFRLDQ